MGYTVCIYITRLWKKKSSGLVTKIQYFVVTGCTWGGHCDHLKCSQWQQSNQRDSLSISGTTSDLQYIPRNMQMVLLCTALWSFCYQFFVDSCDQFISFRVTSLALGQSYDCPSASEVTLKDMGKNLYQTKTKHSKARTICIFLGVYCISIIEPNS